MLSHLGRADVDKVRWFSLLHNAGMHLNGCSEDGVRPLSRMHSSGLQPNSKHLCRGSERNYSIEVIKWEMCYCYQNTSYHPSIVFGDTRLNVSSSHAASQCFHASLLTDGIWVFFRVQGLIASLVRSCSSSRAHSTNTISLPTQQCSPEWPPEEATPLNINAMCLEGFHFKQRACQHQMQRSSKLSPCGKMGFRSFEYCCAFGII